MEKLQTAVIGVGATGTVLAAALVSQDPDTVLVVRRQEQKDELLRKGLTVQGEIQYSVPVSRVASQMSELKEYQPEVVFICTKTFALDQVLDDLTEIFQPGMKLVSAHNGLGPEDVIADRFGADAALRMSLNYGAAATESGAAEVAFFNRPNPLGGLGKASREAGRALASMLTAGGLDTEFVADIKRFVWKKMVMKCTMASICAVTDRTIKDALEFPPTREIAETCFREVLAVSRAMGYDLGEGYLDEMLQFLAKVGVHKDSMCHDVAARRPTEIEFLGGKVVEYGHRHGVPVPAYEVMTNLVRALEDSYL